MTSNNNQNPDKPFISPVVDNPFPAAASAINDPKNSVRIAIRFASDRDDTELEPIAILGYN